MNTEQGTDAFCQLHSIVDTARKNGKDSFMALVDIAQSYGGDLVVTKKLFMKMESKSGNRIKIIFLEVTLIYF